MFSVTPKGLTSSKMHDSKMKHEVDLPKYISNLY